MATAAGPTADASRSSGRATDKSLTSGIGVGVAEEFTAAEPTADSRATASSAPLPGGFEQKEASEATQPQTAGQPQSSIFLKCVVY